MYANLHTFIFTFTLFFFILGANNVQTDCKQTAKKGKTKNSLSLSLRKLKTKLSPNHEEHTAPIIITDFIHNNTRNQERFTLHSFSFHALHKHSPKPLSSLRLANLHLQSRTTKPHQESDRHRTFYKDQSTSG